MKMASGFLVILCLTSVVISAAAYPNFYDLFFINFGKQSTKQLGADEIELGLTPSTGSGFQSKSPYLFGHIAMKLKLVPGDSAGIVTSYYLSSTYPNHCELDFEFLGNVTGQPYTLQTNVFVNGVGNREQRLTLWFDPSAEFHNYGIVWNMNFVLFFVDNTAIRVFRNAVKLGVPYLDYQEMFSFSSIWDGSTWATRGGKDKIDWSYSPFYASYTDFDIEACPVYHGTSAEKHACFKQLYKTSYGRQTLTSKNWADLKWIQSKVTYDYCRDATRWKTQPKECAYNAPH